MMKRDPWKGATLVVAAGLVVAGCGGGGPRTNLGTTVGPGTPGVSATTGARATSTGVSRPPRVGVGGAEIAACAFPVDQGLGPEARVKVTNNTPTPSNYVIRVAFNTKDEAQAPFDTVAVAVTGLAPGQVAEQTASSSKSEVRVAITAGALLCKILSVTRTAT